MMIAYRSKELLGNVWFAGCLCKDNGQNSLLLLPTLSVFAKTHVRWVCKPRMRPCSLEDHVPGSRCAATLSLCPSSIFQLTLFFTRTWVSTYRCSPQGRQGTGLHDYAVSLYCQTLIRRLTRYSNEPLLSPPIEHQGKGKEKQS